MARKSFFQPASVAVIGVSENPQKLGSIIFQNIQEGGYKGDLSAINPKHGGKKLFGAPCFETIKELKKPIDLAVLVIPAKYVLQAVDDCVANKTKNVIVISAGFGEIGNRKAEQLLAQKCAENNINLLGPNCLGAIFPHIKLNASFSDGFPKAGDIAFISQSGAFCTSILDWAKQKDIGFSHFISLGNKAGLSEIECLQSLKNDPKVKLFALYLESVEDGPKLLELLQEITPKKPVIILEPGKSTAAMAASSSHTGSLAPNARILQSAYRQAGAIQVFSMRTMFGLLEALALSEKKQIGPQVAILTNAGGVGVLSTDLVEDNGLKLARFEAKTRRALGSALPPEANTANPVDIVGDADSERYEQALSILCNDKNIDQILVLLTPQRTTEIEKTANVIIHYARKTKKNILASFVGGEKVSPGIQILEDHHIPVFDFPSDALRVMGRMNQAPGGKKPSSPPTPHLFLTKAKHQDFAERIAKAQWEELPSLSQEDTQDLLRAYQFDVPKNKIFSDYSKALSFAQSFFPHKVVLKIASPNALHKTELKGIFLNVNTQEKFDEAWKNLEHSLALTKLKEAKIQVQEQVPNGLEIILGVHQDTNFGHVLLFGTGGIYTEVFADTSLRVLPTNSENLKRMIQETKIGKILQGVRGQEPKALKPLLKTMEKLQDLVLRFPAIKAIDANPVIITEDRAVLVDFKVLV